MKVFLSWSGHRSHEVAKALSIWIKKVIQSADPWISSDMERGVKWLKELGKSLDEHTIGIFCVTPGNKETPWLLFEAGAMSKHLGDEGRVIPYLLDFHSPSDLKAPLGQFNACLADESGTWQLVQTLNSHAEYPQGETDLRETFGLRWPSLTDQLDAIRKSVTTGSPARRSDGEKLDELLEVVRKMSREMANAALRTSSAAERERPMKLWKWEEARDHGGGNLLENAMSRDLEDILEKYDLPTTSMTWVFRPNLRPSLVSAVQDPDVLQRIITDLGGPDEFPVVQLRPSPPNSG